MTKACRTLPQPTKEAKGNKRKTLTKVQEVDAPTETNKGRQKETVPERRTQTHERRRSKIRSLLVSSSLLGSGPLGWGFRLFLLSLVFTCCYLSLGVFLTAVMHDNDVTFYVRAFYLGPLHSACTFVGG